MNELPEDADERRMFDSNVQTLGHPLLVIANALAILASTSPPQGSFAKQMAIMSNEAARAAAKTSLPA